MASLYLVPAAEFADGVARGVVRIVGDEARHAAQVSRVRVGEYLSVSDGSGSIASGAVEQVTPGEVLVRIEVVRTDDAPRPELWLAQALAKGDRDELAIQAATELGVSGVIPWSAERSVSRWTGAKIEKGRARWQTIVREASKQAIRARVPEVAAVIGTHELCTVASEGELLLVLDPTAEFGIGDVDLEHVSRITLVVGPEGGISSAELSAFEAAGARRVRLGSEILRTSTAGPAALSVLNARLGRW
ncbi:16S rRNA (uracil(1498)-N(3))-methyltransferase [uncultured Schumannella sp.]|uniref:16S rRNA (uracil(1498)-N(3))-methyltransferase n=1 Tax=uncultured Schumannella sp. TaxID=1195956 RepID=UPI0025F6FDAC|nr:16S rRNA (uracil(1498)-N(3))-methyltransferase [uncultured Schumannella sp.]